MSERWMTETQAEGLKARLLQIRRDSPLKIRESVGIVLLNGWWEQAIAEATLRPGDAEWCYPQIGEICTYYKWDDGMRCKHPNHQEGVCPKEVK